MNTTSFLEPVALRLSALPPRFEEVIPTVPTKSDELNDRLATVEETVTTIKTTVGVIEKSTVTWKDLFLSLGVIILVVGLVTTIFYKSLLANQIEDGISKSLFLGKSFADIDKQFTLMNARLDKIVSISPILNPKSLSAFLKAATSGDASSLVSALPNVRNILSIAGEKKVPLPAQDYKEISKPLFARYETAKQPLKRELWLTFIEFANTRASTDTVLFPVTNSEIAQANATGNFFEGKNVDLSSRKTWKDTIFRNCTFTISQPENDLTLTHVRFMDSEFQSVAENKTSLNLFRFFIESDGPAVTADVARFTVNASGKNNQHS